MSAQSATVVAKDHFPQLLEKLKSLFPHSLKVYGIVWSIQAGYIEREVIVNQWPDFTALVEKPVAGQGPVYINNVYSIFSSSDVTDLRDFLMQPGIMDWTQERIVIGGCPPTVEPTLREVVQLQNCRIEAAAGDADMYWVTSLEDLPEYKLATGYTLSTLYPADAPTVTEQWQHSDEDTETYTRFLLEHYPSVAIRDSESDALVGYYLQQWHYTLGMLYVSETHRGKGLGKVLIVRAARQALQNGDPAAFCFIEKDNTRSAELHKNRGFKKVEGGDMRWLTIVPACMATSCAKGKCCV